MALGYACIVVLGVVTLVVSSVRGTSQPPIADSPTAMARALRFLTQFGYLPKPSEEDGDSGNLKSESHLRDAIRVMQKFGNVTQTGVLDPPTLALLSRRRCGVPDLWNGDAGAERVRRYALQGQKWPKTDLTWSVDKWAPGADPRMIRDQLSKAFRVWSDVSRLTFREIRSSGADITVSFLLGRHGDGYPFDGRGAVLAHAFFPGEGIGGDAHFDGAELWTSSHADPDEEGVNLFAVAAHEFGHSLGLSHSSVPGSLMFPYYQGINENFQLPFDDRVGIQQLYGAKNPVKWGPLATRAPDPRLPPTPPHPPPTRGPTRPTRPNNHRPPTYKPTKAPPSKKPRPPVHHSPPHPSSEPAPETCSTTFDAISVIRRELFIFKKRWFWRLTDERELMRDYPVTIERFWYNLPTSLDHIDAVYERPIDTKIIFFSGQQFWVYNANRPERGYPRPLTHLGLPADLPRIDAALVWGHNGRTYLFSGRQYWRLDESVGRVEPDYPRDMAMWRGVPYYLDAAFQWVDGKTYFLKGHKFWKFNDLKMRVESKVPGDINHFWLGCRAKTKEKFIDGGPSPTESARRSGAASPKRSGERSTLQSLHVIALIFLTILKWL